jgi:uncharacterized protein (TIGR02594 family)
VTLEPAHVALARTFLGTTEIPGPTDNPQIVKFHGATAAGAAPDDVAWCSSFLCYVFEQLGIPHTRSKSSQSWLAWGVSCDGPTVGAVAIISHPGGKGHVGLVVGVTAQGRVLLLGGNQSNTVSIKSFGAIGMRFRVASAPVLADAGDASSTR